MVVVVAVVDVVLAVGAVVLAAVVVVVGGFALVVVLDDRELVADATALLLADVRPVALAEEDRVTVTDGGLLEPRGRRAQHHQRAMVRVRARWRWRRIFIGRV